MPLAAEHSQLMLQNLESGWGRWGQRILVASVILSHDASCRNMLLCPQRVEFIWAFAAVNGFVPVSLVSLRSRHVYWQFACHCRCVFLNVTVFILHVECTALGLYWPHISNMSYVCCKYSQFSVLNML